MHNRFSYKGGDDLIGRMFVYDDEMKKFDLNSTAIRIFAGAIRKGNLEALQQFFQELTSSQKEGLLTTYIDYNDLSGDFMNLWAPMGYPVNLAEKFNHPQIVTFLKEEINKIEAEKAITNSQEIPKEEERISTPRP